MQESNDLAKVVAKTDLVGPKSGLEMKKSQIEARLDHWKRRKQPRGYGRTLGVVDKQHSAKEDATAWIGYTGVGT